MTEISQAGDPRYGTAWTLIVDALKSFEVPHGRRKAIADAIVNALASATPPSVVQDTEHDLQTLLGEAPPIEHIGTIHGLNGLEAFTNAVRKGTVVTGPTSMDDVRYAASYALDRLKIKCDEGGCEEPSTWESPDLAEQFCDGCIVEVRAATSGEYREVKLADVIRALLWASRGKKA